MIDLANLANTGDKDVFRYEYSTEQEHMIVQFVPNHQTASYLYRKVSPQVAAQIDAASAKADAILALLVATGHPFEKMGGTGVPSVARRSF